MTEHSPAEPEKRPLLSIGIIFKNELRCIERCLESLRPLREAVPCQMVMADTGSSDGSREIAEKYADILFDFPWINDFAAARNAVLDRCTGLWVLSIDCDQWLDESSALLADLIRKPNPEHINAVLLCERSYIDPDMKKYKDYLHTHLLYMPDCPRFEGAIHEYEVFAAADRKERALEKVIVHHDGYIGTYDTEAGAAKRKRNLDLLRRNLESSPNDLRMLLLFLDAAIGDPDFPVMLRRALALIDKKVENWNVWGPIIYRHAVEYAARNGIPELTAWADRAEQLFPESYFVRLDICFILMAVAHEHGYLAESVRYGERFLHAKAEMQGDARTRQEMSLNHYLRADDESERDVRDVLQKDRALLRQRQQESESQRELLSLAEQVRTILSAFPPDHPSVQQLKATPVYQHIRHLIEE